MLKNVIFQVHWALGITVGLVLAVVGITGAMMSFDDEIMSALSSGSRVVVSSAPRLELPELAARLVDAVPHAALKAVTIESDPGRSPQATYEAENAPHIGPKRDTERFYVDPYSGALRGKVVGQEFFMKVQHLHRWMLLPGFADEGKAQGIGIGRRITTVTTISLIFFALSGLYMRWPKRPLDWRSWFKLDLRMTGRNLYHSLHAVVGGWLMLLYLLSGLTGLWWSFGETQDVWYRAAVTRLLTGEPVRVPPPPVRRPGPNPGGQGGQGGQPQRAGPAGEAKVTLDEVQLNNAWAQLQHDVSAGTFDRLSLQIPMNPRSVRFQLLPKGSHHVGYDENSSAYEDITVDSLTGAVSRSRESNQPLGNVILKNVLSIHMGRFFGTPGRIAMATSSATMPLFAVTGWLLYLGRRRKKKALRELQQGGPTTAGDGSFLVVYASQTGGAERLARQTATAFASTGRAVDTIPIDELGAAALARAKTALFVLSTFGDGEPPDSARGFARRRLGSRLDLTGLNYAALVLGDRQYPEFCAFGHRVDQWLGECGARRLFDLVQMDADAPAALETWRQGIATLGAASDAVKIDAAIYTRWRLAERRVLNPGSPGLPAFHIALEPVDGLTPWEAGDIAEILPGHAPGALASIPLPSREYSIASTPPMQRIEFIVRQVQKENGQLGLCSGWLTQHAAVGEEIRLRLRANPAFRAPDESRAVILIGNGTGVAGLLAHIRQRSGRNAAPMWLLFGERSRAHDRFHAEELDGHLAAGTLARIDCAFSRDEGDGRYVQDLIAAASEEIRRWVDGGAAIYVCGSLKSMAPAVDLYLREILGDPRMEELTVTGRYRRDIY